MLGVRTPIGVMYSRAPHIDVTGLELSPISGM